MLTKSAALREAPPTRPPSTSGCSKILLAISGLREPPYTMRVLRAISSP